MTKIRGKTSTRNLHFGDFSSKVSVLGLSTEWGDRIFQSIIVRSKDENLYNVGVVLTVDRNILPGMKPTRHSFSCGQPLGPRVAHHGMRNLVHHA